MHTTDAIEMKLQQIHSLLASHEEAYEVQCATMARLQLQMNEMAEIQHATMKQLQLQMELSTNNHRQSASETSYGSDAKETNRLQQNRLVKQVQQEMNLNLREDVGVSAFRPQRS